MINWKIRFKNWLWVSSFLSQIMIVIQFVLVGANAAGWTTFVLTEEIQTWTLGLANAVFVTLAMLGIVQDPTVEGIGDSARALERKKPLPESQKDTDKFYH